uniref:Uncharacterized protein n=1 Tax=Pseudictyota dubia TaxID=2749911 RepID=A0A7R9W645_9STRA|mmetsp:Transcript_3598/g.6287  ORF Transcript_3598/g.6287 Transcript_3598/m.6287 type:complete len:115 (+) Transcript_3598:241-585(+)
MFIGFSGRIFDIALGLEDSSIAEVAPGVVDLCIAVVLDAAPPDPTPVASARLFSAGKSPIESTLSGIVVICDAWCCINSRDARKQSNENMKIAISLVKRRALAVFPLLIERDPT